MDLTITEALAEIKTISSRVEKHRQNVLRYLVRDAALKDPLEREGGSVQYIQRERQTIKDLETRWIAIRLAIQATNLQKSLEVEGVTKTVAEWLAWRRELSPSQEAFLNQMQSTINTLRQKAFREGGRVVEGKDTGEGGKEYVFHLCETGIAQEAISLSDLLGRLDGRLSLFNATTTITIP